MKIYDCFGYFLMKIYSTEIRFNILDKYVDYLDVICESYYDH